MQGMTLCNCGLDGNPNLKSSVSLSLGLNCKVSNPTTLDGETDAQLIRPSDKSKSNQPVQLRTAGRKYELHSFLHEQKELPRG